jgi:outer membrane cobalamin receptor
MQLITFLAAASVSAQVRDTTRTTALDSTRAVPLAPIVVTAIHVPVRADRLGFAVSVLDAATIRRDRPANAVDALRSVQGVFVEEAAGPGGPTIVRLRGGEEVFTRILVDGVPINQNGGFFDFQGLSFGNLDRIEVARGPQSAVHGSSAVSGVVNFLTRAGQPGEPQLAASVGGSAASGDGGGYRARSEMWGGSNRVRYSTGVGYSYDRGFFDKPHDTRSTEASLRLDAAVSDRVDLTGTLRFAGVDAMLPVRDPGATRAPLDPNARSERNRLISSLVSRVHQGRVDHSLRGTLYRESFVYDDRFDGVTEEQQYPFFIFDANFRLDSRLLRTGLEYTGSFRTGAEGSDVAVTWGGLVEHEDLEDATSGDFPASMQQLDRSSIAGFGELLVTPTPWLDLLAGARVERYEGLSSVVTPRASAVIDLMPLFGSTADSRLLSLRFAAGRAYKAPNLQDQFLENPFILSNPGLEPETSTSIEAGIEAHSLAGRVSAGLTAFRQQFEDLIRTVATDDPDGRQQNRNLGSSRATGVEWNVTVRARPGLALGTDGTWVRTRIIDNSGLSNDAFPVGESLPGRPDITAAAFVEANLGSAVRASVRTRYIGEQTVLTERFSGARVEIDPYTITGLTLNWDATREWTLWTRFDNLFGTDYQTAFDRPGIPATASIGMEWRN